MTTFTYVDNLYWLKSKPFLTASADEFIDIIKNQKTIFEVTSNTFTKLYFDIDCQVPMDEYTEQTAIMIENKGKEYLFNALHKDTGIEPNIAMATSHAKEYEKSKEDGSWISKYSVRYFVSNMKATKSSLLNFVKYINKVILVELEDHSFESTWIYEYISPESVDKELFDTSVYDPNRKMRCINSSKPNENRPLILREGSVENTIINGFYDDECVEMIFQEEEKPTTSKSPRSIQDIQKIEDLNILVKLSECWSADRIENSFDWFRLGWGVANTFGKSKEVEDIFVNLNDRVPKRKSKTEKENAREWFQNKCEIRNDINAITIGSLKKWAKEDNEHLYKESFEKSIVAAGSLAMKLQHEIEELMKKTKFSTGVFAAFFKKLYSDKFIAVDGIIYHYNGVYWKRDDNKNLITHKFLSNDVFPFIEKFCMDKIFGIKKNIEELKVQLKAIEDKGQQFTMKGEIYELKQQEKNVSYKLECFNRINEHTSRKAIIDDNIVQINKMVKLDKNPYLFAFENKVFDLKTSSFIPSNPEDYLTLSCGYDYDDKYDLEKNKTELFAIIDQIFPNKDVRDFHLECLSTGLFGQQVEHLFVNTGAGGNGKSLLNSFAMATFGTYGYKLPSSALLSEIKQGANPQMANLHKKRFILTQEPDCNKRMNASTMKEITGDEKLNVRDNYSSVCITILFNTTFLEANELPLLTEINDAITRRIRTIPFVSSFVDQSTYDSLEDKTNVFVGKSCYKSNEFQSQIKQALFHILADYFKIYMENNNCISPMPPLCYEAGKKYFMMSDDFINWFNDNYERDESSYVYVSDVFDNYKISSAYSNLSKNDKRKQTKANFDENIQKNIFLKASYKPKDAYFNKIRLKKPFLFGYKIVSNEEESSDEVYKIVSNEEEPSDEGSDE